MAYAVLLPVDGRKDGLSILRPRYSKLNKNRRALYLCDDDYLVKPFALEGGTPGPRPGYGANNPAKVSYRV